MINKTLKHKNFGMLFIIFLIYPTCLMAQALDKLDKYDYRLNKECKSLNNDPAVAVVDGPKGANEYCQYHGNGDEKKAQRREGAAVLNCHHDAITNPINMLTISFRDVFSGTYKGCNGCTFHDTYSCPDGTIVRDSYGKIPRFR